MDITSLLDAIVGAKAPIITGVIVIVGMIINNKGVLEPFKNEVRDKVKGDIKEIFDDFKKILAIHEQKIVDSDAQFKEMKNAIDRQTALILSHDEKINVYSDIDCFKREIRETVNHSLAVLEGSQKLLAAEYLYAVSNKICELIDVVSIKGITTLSRLDLDAYTANAMRDVKEKFTYIYGSDKCEQYFKENRFVETYKIELFALLDDMKVNNIERRYRTLTIRWFEELCARFIRKMYLKEN